MKAIPSVDNCQLCGQDLRAYASYFDSKQRGSTQWAWMCFKCWLEYGASLGTGKAQKYDSVTDEKLGG